MVFMFDFAFCIAFFDVLCIIVKRSNITGRQCMEKKYTKILLDNKAGAMKEVFIRKHALKNYVLHRHDCFEFELVISGSARHTVNGETNTISRGDMYLILPTDIHGLELEEEGELYNIMFRESIISKDILLEFLNSNLNTVHLSHEDFTRICFLIESAIKESTEKRRFASLFMHNLIECIFITFLRNQQTNVKKTIPQQGVVHAALIYIQSHYTSNLTLHDVATHVFLSDSYFSRLFHIKTGVTFKKYLSNLRLVYATKLLRSSSLSVTEICFDCGYTSFSHFLRSFRETYGTSPGEYRSNAAPNKTEK